MKYLLIIISTVLIVAILVGTARVISSDCGATSDIFVDCVTSNKQ